MPYSRIAPGPTLALTLAVLAFFAAPWSRAQTSASASASKTAASSAASPAPLNPKVSRSIELTLRDHLQIPPEYVIHIGQSTPSTTPGFDTLPIFFELPGHPEHSQQLDFLISKDGKTLERVSHWAIPADPASLIPAGTRPVRGNPNAKVTLVNFDDLECPYCAKLHSELFPDTLEHYKGLIKIVYRDMPIEQLHPWAMHAAVNANCLADQSGTSYWSYVDYLHTHGEDITGPDRDIKKSDAMLDKLALQQGEKDKLDTTKLQACVAKQDQAPVRQEMKLSDRLNINQTPTLYINGEMIAGALPKDVLWPTIDRALVAEGVTPPPDPYSQPAKSPAPADASASIQP
ncbi:MAG: thioredoxin domain-containing protein [Acidobacteriaceae bacterium]